MSQRVTITAAEVAFLLASFDPDGRTVVPALIGITDEERSAVVTASGLSSLVARGLALPAGEQIQLAPQIAAIAEGLTRNRICVQLGLVSDERADGAVIFDTGAVRFLVGPRTHRCFDLTGLDSTVDLSVPITHIAHRFLSEFRPGVASIRVDVGNGERPAGHRLLGERNEAGDGFGWLTIAVGAAGDWSLAVRDGPDGIIHFPSEDEAIAGLSEALAAIVSPILG